MEKNKYKYVKNIISKDIVEFLSSWSLNNFNLKGLWTINETKLKNLDDKLIIDLHSKGYLQHIYMIAASIGNMNNLIHLKKIKESSK